MQCDRSFLHKDYLLLLVNTYKSECNGLSTGTQRVAVERGGGSTVLLVFLLFIPSPLRCTCILSCIIQSLHLRVKYGK